MFVERDGEVVTRDELKQKLWPNDTIVDFDHSINIAIRKLRQAFGDSADEPNYIATWRGGDIGCSFAWNG